MNTKRMAVWLLCGVMALGTGCTSYYRVNDPAGSKLYYTTDIDNTKSGAITFTDKKSGSVVTLQSSEVKEISEAEFTAGVAAEERKDK